MSKTKTKEELTKHKEDSIKFLSDYLDSLIDSDDSKLLGKVDKLSYWIKDWTTFLNYETEFKPSSLRRYKRGEIIKVHLGFNIGSEEGGLHYAIVLDKNNSRNSPVVTVVPLTSVKPKTDINHLHKGNLFLGNELFTSLNSKCALIDRTLRNELNDLTSKVNSPDWTPEESEKIKIRLDEATKKFELLKKLSAEINKMKRGSIALTGQITTISKIRIYDPKTNMDVLSNVKLSNEKLDLIDNEILHNFTGYK